MSDQIEHFGVIKTIEGKTAFVVVEQTSACSACSAKKMCVSSEKAEKTIETTLIAGEKFREGERVKVVGKSSLGLQAVLLAFVVPFLLILAILAIAIEVLAWPELMAALAALAAVGLYYFVLRLSKNSMKRHFAFYCEKI